VCVVVQVTASFWQSWKEFEIRHGNEDTIREMLRIKRSVQATYNTQVNFMSSQMMKATTSSTGTGEGSHRGQCGGWVRVCWVPLHLITPSLSLSLLPLSPPSLVSDLAPGQLGLDDMKMLEQKAQLVAAEAQQDKVTPTEKILFVRWAAPRSSTHWDTGILGYWATGCGWETNPRVCVP